MKVLKIDITFVSATGASRAFAFAFPYSADLLAAIRAGKISAVVGVTESENDYGAFEGEEGVHEAIRDLLTEPPALTALKSAFQRTSVSSKAKSAKKRKTPRRREKISE